MKNILNQKSLLALIAAMVISFSCQDQLDVKNPNEPTIESLNSENGIVNFAQGSVYLNGFVDLKYVDGVLGRFLGNGYHDLWADVVGAEAANVFMNQIGAPFNVILDDDSEVPNPGSPRSQAELIKNNNVNANAGNNPLFYDWAYMYSLNNVCNVILNSVESVEFVSDADTKRNVLKAWAHWWKAFAYSRIGSVYVAGVINDEPNVTNGNYVTNAQILDEANRQLDLLEDILETQTNTPVYTEFLGRLIPDFFQQGKGNPLSPDEWKRNINTLRARILLANKRVEDMTNADWNQIITFTTNGIQEGDNVFTVRSNSTGDIISANTGTIATKSTGDPNGEATYKISERLVSDFRAGDQRFDNNFIELDEPWIGESARGNSFNTRWQLVDGGNGIDDVIVYGDKTPGATETYVSVTYEENLLMRAEANIYLGNINAGLQLIDEVRDYQGAGLAALDGSGLSQNQAVEELRSERRVALLFRYVSFYDARRYGILDPLSEGGGRTGAIVIDRDGNLNINATIDYQFMDYFHVPDNELKYNPPVSGSAPVVNSKFM
ncbi:MAG: RagB/SusD family nutrient uptake outer membrane protein [Flammeovirgaceae bacterium]|jgi:hypothetical protein|nr:RagB/SusD family nutrient uptake outer membrane protein [Flammeovirgaceae bacterium]